MKFIILFISVLISSLAVTAQIKVVCPADTIVEDSVDCVFFCKDYPYSKPVLLHLKMLTKRNYSDTIKFINLSVDTLSEINDGIDRFLNQWIKENENCYPCQKIYSNYQLYGSQLFAYEIEGDTIVLMNYIFQ
ncbi:MAG: hypothetical protein LPK45_09120, partial [Bacteroidota bacterium]|nr:hypothetical protein [Bacteroidota bacterium]MDX5431244.1 hypothetical protein [Bacteroidota bacterium]MDX5469983.1 hypothetical protein [Bacteroidota bacterium]